MTRKIWTFLIRCSSIWKTAMAAGVAWEVAQLTGAHRPYFAPLAAILCLQVTVQESIWRGYQRVLGIIVGVLLASGIVSLIGLHGWSIALVVLIGTGLASVLRIGQQAIPQVGVSAMMVLTVGAHQYQYAYERVVDTLIGAIIAIAINILVVPPDYTPEARRSLGKAAEQLAERFRDMATWLKEGGELSRGRDLQQQTRAYLDILHAAEDEVATACRALRYRPFVQRRSGYLHRLEQDMLQLRQGYAHATGMLRTLLEWCQSDAVPPSDTVQWQARLYAMARHIEDWSARATEPHRAPAVADKTDAREAMPAPYEVDGSMGNRYEFALFNDFDQLSRDFGDDAPSARAVGKEQ